MSKSAGTKAQKRPRILHLHSTFAAGGKEVRCAQLISAFGNKLQHDIVSAVPESMEARSLISKKLPVSYPDDFPSLQGKPFPRETPSDCLAR